MHALREQVRSSAIVSALTQVAESQDRSSFLGNLKAHVYHDLASVMIELLIVAFFIVQLLPLVIQQLTGMNVSDFPTGTSTLITVVLPIVIILGIVYMVYKKIKVDSSI